MPTKVNEDIIVPKDAWKKIKKYIPNERLYMPFWINGNCGRNLKELGFNVFHQNMDFWEQVEDSFFDIIIGIVSRHSTPYVKQDIIIKLIELDKPFILIMGTKTLNTGWFRTLMTSPAGKQLQLIFNSKRIKFEDKEGKAIKRSFDTCFYCYKINLIQDILFV